MAHGVDRIQAWNVLHAAGWKYTTQKSTKKFAIWAPSHKLLGLYLSNYGTYRQSEKEKKNLLHSNISLTCSHNMVKFGPLGAEIGSLVWGTQRISTGFASWLRYW